MSGGRRVEIHETFDVEKEKFVYAFRNEFHSSYRCDARVHKHLQYLRYLEKFARLLDHNFTTRKSYRPLEVPTSPAHKTPSASPPSLAVAAQSPCSITAQGSKCHGVRPGRIHAQTAAHTKPLSRRHSPCSIRMTCGRELRNASYGSATSIVSPVAGPLRPSSWEPAGTEHVGARHYFTHSRSGTTSWHCARLRIQPTMTLICATEVL